MASGISWRTLEQRISAAVKLQRRAVSVAFLDAPPSGVERFEGTEPSGCSFWRLAAAGRSFYTVPENHCNCAVGAYTHHLPLPPDREKETEQTLQRMFDLGYVKPEEVAQFARRPKTPAVVAYALSATHRCAGYGFVRVQVGRSDAAGRGGGKCRIASGVRALGRPTCMALPASLQAGSILSLGCAGNRVYTGLMIFCRARQGPFRSSRCA